MVLGYMDFGLKIECILFSVLVFLIDKIVLLGFIY